MSLADNTILTSLKLLVTRLQPKRCVNAWIVAILLVSLVGCSQPSTVSSLHALHERVAFTLDIELTPLTFEPRPPQLPDVRVLKPTASTPTMRFLTALQLNHCRAGQLIAERNSALGRLDDGFSRFQDDQSLIKALRQCAKSPQSKLLQLSHYRCAATERHNVCSSGTRACNGQRAQARANDGCNAISNHFRH